jgi:hypothetical protein
MPERSRPFLERFQLGCPADSRLLQRRPKRQPDQRANQGPAGAPDHDRIDRPAGFVGIERRPRSAIGLRDIGNVPVICPTCQNVFADKSSVPATAFYFAWGCFRYFCRERELCRGPALPVPTRMVSSKFPRIARTLKPEGRWYSTLIDLGARSPDRRSALDGGARPMRFL